jgi:hypothetical protein
VALNFGRGSRAVDDKRRIGCRRGLITSNAANTAEIWRGEVDRGFGELMGKVYGSWRRMGSCN